MAFSKPIITKLGKEMSIKALIGNGNIRINAVHIGQSCNADNPTELNKIISYVMDADIIGYNIEDNSIILEFAFDNSKLNNDFFWKEYGIMATYTSSDGVKKEGLFCYGFDNSQAPAQIPKFTGKNSYLRSKYRVAISVGNADNVTVNLKEFTDYVLREEFENKIAIASVFYEFFAETIDGGMLDD